MKQSCEKEKCFFAAVSEGITQYLRLVRCECEGNTKKDAFKLLLKKWETRRIQ
jgi:hypothetical protein